MEKSSVAPLEEISNQATIKLKEVHAIRVNDILSYIAFIETSNEKLADNPTQWAISHFRKWKRDGCPSNVTIQPGNQSTVSNATTPS